MVKSKSTRMVINKKMNIVICDDEKLFTNTLRSIFAITQHTTISMLIFRYFILRRHCSMQIYLIAMHYFWT